jgi:hypothetical protein
VIGLILAMNIGKETNKATWLWDTKIIINEPDTIVSFLKENKVNLLYLQINEQIRNMDYKRFIKKLSKENIEVHALGGSPEWASEDSCLECESFIKWIRDYQKEAEASEKFSGVHLGMEELIRWEHPRLGLISPAEFIPIAERIGKIVQIGNWVLEKGCVQNKKLQQQGYDPLVVSVNVSVRQLQDQGFFTF